MSPQIHGATDLLTASLAAYYHAAQAQAVLSFQPPCLPPEIVAGPSHPLQLVTRRNREFYLPSDRAPAGSAVETQLESLARRQTDAAKVAEEAERWERVSQG